MTEIDLDALDDRHRRWKGCVTESVWVDEIDRLWPQLSAELRAAREEIIACREGDVRRASWCSVPDLEGCKEWDRILAARAVYDRARSGSVVRNDGCLR